NESPEPQAVERLNREGEEDLPRPDEPVVDDMSEATAGVRWTEKMQLAVGRSHQGCAADLEQAGDAPDLGRRRGADDEHGLARHRGVIIARLHGGGIPRRSRSARV